MVCSGCDSVALFACSNACAFTLELRGDVVVGRCLLLRSKGASARSVEPGVLFGDVGAVERGRRVLRKRGMLVCMANGGRYCERSWQMCSVVTRLQVRVVAPTGFNALEPTNVAGWELCAGNGIRVLCLDSVLSWLC